MTFPFNVAAPRHDALVKAVWSALRGGGSELADAVDSMFYSPATRKLVVRLRDATPSSLLAAWVPDPGAALRVDQGDEPEASRVTGVSVTLRAAPAEPAAPPLVAFYSRYFSPWNGIPEDPVNGSSHTILGPLWADMLGAWGPLLSESAETAAAVPGGLPEGVASDAGADLVHSQARLRAVQLSARGGTLDLLCVRAQS
jgi:predicted PhzF superfamily epimerase YddE/YHI9